MMLAFLLARMGVDVFVLEKHADFLRDFRGDTIHPSTLELMHELGILDDFLKRPHDEVRELSGQVGNDIVTMGDFTHLPTHCKFLALMPQWDFLDFIKEQASRYPTFHLRMNAEVTDLLEEQGSVVGLRAKTSDGSLEIRAPLTIGADGRHSVVRQRANLEVIDLGAPMDVMWMRISRGATDPGQTLGHFDRGKILVMINRESYWQCAFVIPKGEADRISNAGCQLFAKASPSWHHSCAIEWESWPIGRTSVFLRWPLTGFRNGPGPVFCASEMRLRCQDRWRRNGNECVNLAQYFYEKFPPKANFGRFRSAEVFQLGLRSGCRSLYRTM